MTDHSITLKAKNDTSRAFAEMEQNARKAATGITSTFREMSSELKTAGLGLVAFSAVGTALIAKSTLLAARVQTLGVVLQVVGKNAGYSAGQLGQYEAEVRKMGITTQAARQSLIRLAQANIDLADAQKIARVAQDAAVIGGVNSSEAFERLVHGMVTRQPEILRTIGILVNFEQEYVRFAKANDVAVESLTELQKQQIASNAVLEAGTRIAGSYEQAMTTAGKQMTSLARFTEEAQLALGQAFLPAFSELIMSLTAGLEWFNKLNPETQRFASYTLAGATAVTALSGTMLLLASKMPGIIDGLSKVGNLVGGMSGNMAVLGTRAGFATSALANAGSAALALGTAAAVAAAVIALTAAISKLIQFNQQLKAQTATMTEVIREHQGEVARTAQTYDEYLAEMRRVQDLTGRAMITQEGYNAQARAGRNVAVTLKDAIVVQTRAQWENNAANRAAIDATQGWTEEMYAAYRGLALLTEGTEREAAAAAEMSDAMAELGITMEGKLGQSVRDYRAEIEDLQGTQGALMTQIADAAGWKYVTPEQQQQVRDLGREYLRMDDTLALYRNKIQTLQATPHLTDAQREQLKSLQESYGKTQDRMAGVRDTLAAITGQGYFTEDQKQALADLIGAYDGIGAQISATADAHRDATNRMIFDLLATKAAADGVSDAEYDFLVGLANGLGLIDDTTADAAQKMNEALLLVNAGELGRANSLVQGVLSGLNAIDGMSVEASIFVSGMPTRPTVAGASSRGGFVPEAGGGYPQRGGWTMVGEGGWEMIGPSGRVYTHRQSMAMMSAGVTPRRRAAIDPGGGGAGGSGPVIITETETREEQAQIREAMGTTTTSTTTTSTAAAAEAAAAATDAAAAVQGVQAATQAAVSMATTGLAGVAQAQAAALASQLQQQQRAQAEQTRVLREIKDELRRQGTMQDLAGVLATQLTTYDPRL